LCSSRFGARGGRLRRRLLIKAGFGLRASYGIPQLLAEQRPRNGAVTAGSGSTPSSAASEAADSNRRFPADDRRIERIKRVEGELTSSVAARPAAMRPTA